MKREVIRVEPISSWLERWKAPASPVTRAGNMIFVSGLPPFDPDTGEILPVAIERQTELVMAQLKQCLEAAGASLDDVMKCNIFCTSAKHFPAVNAIYARYFPEAPPARIFVCIPEWTGALRHRDRLHRHDLGREPTNLPGGRLARVRFEPIATELLRCRE